MDTVKRKQRGVIHTYLMRGNSICDLLLTFWPPWQRAGKEKSSK